MSGTIVTSAPRRSSSSASGFASGRVTTMRRPQSGWSATDRRQYAVRARGKRVVARVARPSSCGSPSPSNAHHLTSIDRCDEALETHPRGRRRRYRERRDRAPRSRRRAPAQERPLGRRRRRVQPDRRARREARASRRRRRGTGPRAPPGRAPEASSRLDSHSVTACSSPSRRTPAAASTAASNSPSLTLRIRVSTFPRIERISRSRSERRELRRAAQAARPDDGARRRAPRASAAPGATRQSRTSSRARDRADDDARRILGREILERVHGEVDLAVAERPLELGGEEALAADLGQRLAARLRPVAGGRDHASSRTRDPGHAAAQQRDDERRSAHVRAPKPACRG